MRYRLIDQIRNFLPAQTKRQYEGFLAKLKKEGCRPGSLTVACVKDIGWVLVDGYHTHDACKELEIPLPEPFELDEEFNDLAAVMVWVEDNQAFRRNQSEEIRARLVAERQYRVRAAREQGKTFRVIAEEEGICLTQAHRDAQSANTENHVQNRSGVPHGTPVPQSTGKTVVGRDGKTYAASCTEPTKSDRQKIAEMRCKRCERLDVRDLTCGNCKAVREQALIDLKATNQSRTHRPKNSKKPPKNGSVIFDIDQWDSNVFGPMILSLSELYAAYGLTKPGGSIKRDAEYEAMNQHIVEFRSLFKQRHNDLTKAALAATQREPHG